VLASAEQFVAVFDPASGAKVQRFPAVVWPSRQATTGECSTVLAGEGWFATYGNLTSQLTVHDAAGRRVGTRRLDRLFAVPAGAITAVGAAGRYLGAAYVGAHTLEVTFDPSCVDEAAAAVANVRTQP
jgi:hypothetical protein